MKQLKNLFYLGIFLATFGYWGSTNANYLHNDSPARLALYGLSKGTPINTNYLHFSSPARLAISGVIILMAFLLFSAALYWDKNPKIDPSLPPKMKAMGPFILLGMRAIMSWITAAMALGWTVFNMGAIAAMSANPQLLTTDNIQVVRSISIAITYVGGVVATIGLILIALSAASKRDAEARAELAI